MVNMTQEDIQTELARLRAKHKRQHAAYNMTGRLIAGLESLIAPPEPTPIEQAIEHSKKK